MCAREPSLEEQFKINFNDGVQQSDVAFICLYNPAHPGTACGHPGEGEMETSWERKLSTLWGTGLSGEHGPPGYRSGKSFSLSDSPCFNKQVDNA